MSAPSPGPWRVVVSADGQIDTIIRSALGRTAAEAWGDSETQRIANANLIAAAPDLLAACEKLAATYERCRTQLTDGDWRAVLTCWREHDAEIRATIAKARGVR